MKTPEKSNDERQASRRRFTKAVAAAFVAAPLVAASSRTRGQTPPATREATAPPNPQATPTPASTPPPPSPLALAYMEAARLRFGEKLTPEELKRVQNELEGNVRTAERLRAVKLKNADEPDFTFIA